MTFTITITFTLTCTITTTCTITFTFTCTITISNQSLMARCALSVWASSTHSEPHCSNDEAQIEESGRD